MRKEDKKFRILDCTLRDGLKIVNYNIEQDNIRNFIGELSAAKIDFIECGYLVAKLCETNSTLFSNTEQIDLISPDNLQDAKLTAFIDYSKYNINNLPERNKTKLSAIRLGFTYKNFKNEYPELLNTIKNIKSKGYNLFLQPMNTVCYTEKEIEQLVRLANDMNAYSIGIVDTYGHMNDEDFNRIYSVLSKYLIPEIKINYHSHNNIQKSYELATRLIELSQDIPNEIIIDGTIGGIGRCAGNIITEDIAQYLNQNCNGKYNIELLNKVYTNKISSYRKIHDWKYDVIYEFGAKNEIHPQYMQLLNNNNNLRTDEKIKILNSIPKESRESFNADIVTELIKMK